MTLDLARLEKLAASATAEPDADEPSRCRGCGVRVVTDPELEPSALCNPCAQDHAIEMGGAIPALLAMVRRTATIEPHLATLRDMHRRAELELAGAERDERLGTLSADTVEWYRQRAAALRAVLGEPT